jgi:hypothetical protein
MEKKGHPFVDDGKIHTEEMRWMCIYSIDDPTIQSEIYILIAVVYLLMEETAC